jgi:hypothetical protein
MWSNIRRLFSRKVKDEAPADVVTVPGGEEEERERPSVFTKEQLRGFFESANILSVDDAGLLASVMFTSLPDDYKERFTDMASEMAWDIEEYCNNLALENQVPSLAIYMSTLYIAASWKTTILDNLKATHPEAAEEILMMVSTARSKLNRGDKPERDVSYG